MVHQYQEIFLKWTIYLFIISRATKKLTMFAQTRSPQYQFSYTLYQVWWKSIEIYSIVILKWKYQITLSNIYENCPRAILNKIFTISMHKPSLVKILIYLLQLLSGNDNTEVLRSDKSVENCQNLLISDPKPDLYNIKTYITPCRATRTPMWNHNTLPLSCGEYKNPNFLLIKHILYLWNTYQYAQV